MPPTRMPQPSGLLRTSSELVLFFGCCNASVRDLTLIKRSDNFFRTCSESVVRRARPYAGWRIDDDNKRSEEHTSELQSLMRISYAVFCLKKKNILQQKYIYNTEIT